MFPLAPRRRPWSLITDHWSLVTLGLLLLTLGAGCRLVQNAIDVPGKTVRAVTPGKKGNTRWTRSRCSKRCCGSQTNI